MAKICVFIIPAIFFFMQDISEGLECYHCYSGKLTLTKDNQFVSCNEGNLTLSNTWMCPNPKARCIYAVVEVPFLNDKQIWRTCSNSISDPCDPNSFPQIVKILKCSHCGTDKCNLQFSENEKNNTTFTFNINANVNVNLYIRQ